MEPALAMEIQVAKDLAMEAAVTPPVAMEIQVAMDQAMEAVVTPPVAMEMQVATDLAMEAVTPPVTDRVVALMADILDPIRTITCFTQGPASADRSERYNYVNMV